MISNPNITWEKVLANPHEFKEPWYFTENPNITWEIVCYIMKKYPMHLYCLVHLYSNNGNKLL